MLFDLLFCYGMEHIDLADCYITSVVYRSQPESLDAHLQKLVVYSRRTGCLNKNGFQRDPCYYPSYFLEVVWVFRSVRMLLSIPVDRRPTAGVP